MSGMFELMVVGGAVGSSWGGPAGWAAYVIVRDGPAVRLVAAGEATLAEADLKPFQAALLWHRAKYTPGKALFITDSPDLVDRKASEFEGYDITWQIEPRVENAKLFEEADRARAAFSAQHERARLAFSGAHGCPEKAAP